jgi:hypothetical protein
VALAEKRTCTSKLLRRENTTNSKPLTAKAAKETPRKIDFSPDATLVKSENS